MPATVKLRLRRATLADSEDIWRWRNDPLTRRSSLSTRKIPWKKHKLWFVRAMKDPCRHIFLAVCGRLKIGVLRYDLKPRGIVEVGINVNPECRGRGFGKRILKMSNALIRKKYPACAQKAIIRISNKASSNIFAAGGFVKRRELQNPVRAVWIRQPE